MKKKIYIGLISVLLIAIVTIGGTLAWLTDDDKVKNTVTIGNVDIRVLEEWDDENDGKDISANTRINKKPYITNTGKNPAYIRAKIIVSDSYYLDYLEFDYNIDADNGKWFMVEENNEVYFYYKEILAPTEPTEHLFTYFLLNDTFIEPKSTEQNVPKFFIDIYAEAIQSEGFEPLYTEVEDESITFRTAILNAFANYTK